MPQPARDPHRARAEADRDSGLADRLPRPTARLLDREPKIYPNGCALCVAELVDCRPMVEADAPLAWVRLYEGFSWVLENARPITPFTIKGRQRFFRATVPDGVGYLPRFEAKPQGELFGSL